MLNRRRQIAGLFKAGPWLRSQTGRVLSGLVLAATAPQVTDAARKDERRADNQDRKQDHARNDRDTSDEKKQAEIGSDEQKTGKASAETRDAGDKSDNSGKRVRDESANENDENRGEKSSDSDKARDDSRRNADSDSSETSADDDSHRQGRRHVSELEQRADETTGDSPPEDSPVTNVTPANPNVAIGDIPSSPIADLVVDANDDVIANVSSSGGFAFARSGDVIAVSGPDGASIIQTGDVSAGTSGTSPADPSDGGNNDVDFSS